MNHKLTVLFIELKTKKKTKQNSKIIKLIIYQENEHMDNRSNNTNNKLHQSFALNILFNRI